jgi:Spy/CpxP family protein refolding chaperone
MLRKLKLIAGSSLLIGGLAFATYAEDQQTTPSPPANNQGMMGGDTAGMMHQMPQQMTEQMTRMMQQMTPEMREQMTRMMEDCNRMMEGHMQQQPTPPEPEKKG